MGKISVKKTVLPNGVRVVSERMDHVRSVSLGIWIGVGSGNETNTNNGISHFLEHMVFKGSKKRSAREIALSLESLGGSINGSTGKDVTVYTAYVLDEHIDIAIDVLTDIIREPKLSDSDITLEKNVVLAEISHSLENPEDMILDEFYSHLFPNHPLGFLILGKPENVRKFGREDLLNFMQQEYTGDRFVFAAAGHVDHDHFVELVKRHFEPFAITSNNKHFVPLPKASTGVIRHSHKSSNQAHIVIGSTIFGYNDERKYALALLDLTLGGGMSSRLFQNIREKYGFAYNVYSFTDLMADIGAFGCYMACDVKRVDQAVELLMHEIDKIRKNTITEKELDMIKSQVKGMMLLGMESSSRRMRKIAETEIYNAKHISLDEVLEKVNKISPSDLTEIANEFLAEPKLTTTILTP